MASYRTVTAIEVRIWNRRVGAVARDPGIGYYVFEYDPAFVRTGIELAPLTMPLSAARDPFVFPELPEATYRRLPAMLADALPDDFGNALIDAWMASRGVDKARITALDRLAYMGRRAMGALEFKPARGNVKAPATAVRLSRLVETARRAVGGTLASDDLAHAALMQMIQVGTSAGGARAKAVVLWNAETDEVRAGQFEAAPGFEHWLLKFDGIGMDRELGVSQHYGRIEYAYSQMARAAGIHIAPCRLLEENGRAHFMTKRFDRDGDRRHHLQSLCAIAHLDFRQRATHDASQLLQTVVRLRLGYEAREEAFRRVAFNVMAANCDDHTKNVSFLLRESGAWELAPAYDLTHAHNPKGQWTYQHLMSVNGAFADVARADLLALADRFAIGTAPQVLARVAEAVAAWPGHAADAGLPRDEVARVAADHRRL